MKHLEEEIDDLHDLDDLRVRSAEWRDQGREALREIRPQDDRWGKFEYPIEKAVLVKALCDHRPDLSSSKNKLLETSVKELETLSAEKILSADPSDLPILKAARTLQALTAAPSSAFSKSVLLFYYQIIRELYSADAPDWRIGGARAGEGVVASAYVTGECVRAILGFARALDNTGGLLRGLQEIRERRDRLGDRWIPESWRAAEEERLGRDFYTTILRLSDNIALKLGPWAQGLDPELINSFLDEAPAKIKRAVQAAAQTFQSARNRIELFRNKEKPGKRFDRSATGHAVALGAVDQAVKEALAAQELFSEGRSDLDASLRELASMFQKTARDVRKLVHPARAFLSAALDRELTAAGSGANPGWDPGEMAFAAASYGFAMGNWDDGRLRVAGIRLSEILSERGRFPTVKPFWVDDKGNHIEVLGVEVLRALSQLQQNVQGIPVEGSLIRRMLMFFEDTRREMSSSPTRCGWYPEQVLPPAKPLRWVTGMAVLGLDHLNRMLDDRINAQIFRHFTVRKPQGSDLRSLFYPDYGLRLAPKEMRLRRESVAISLERMRAHVGGVPPPGKGGAEPLFSMVLHGPPGTGKTTLIEALATSCGVPLVQVTPSDIVLGGADAVERRARAVFEALALLTGTVILFDEFDPVLRRRNPDDTGPSTVFSFLTPGMLPKLKNLHEKARKRRVSYALITNLIGTLDEAAVRAGRFDCTVGLYPPDPLSRAGRLINEVLAFQRGEKTHRRLPKDFMQRVQAVVRDTAGAPMEALARKGWFVRSKDRASIPSKSPFDLILKGGSPEIEWPMAEAELRGVLGEGRAADLEYYQWRWIQLWDEILKRQGISLEEALQTIPGMPPGPAGAQATPVSLVAWNLAAPPSGPAPVPSKGSGNGNGRRAGRVPSRPARQPHSPSPD